MNKISILDCTLREGGYVNDWLFGKKNIRHICRSLSLSGIEFIECGFLKNSNYDKDKSLYNSLELLKPIIRDLNSKFCLMINYGEIDFIPENQYGNIYFRVAFRKPDRLKAINYCKKLHDKGYKIFINSMTSSSYSDDELKKLIEQINVIEPYAYTISDTLGCMNSEEIIRQFSIADKNLSHDIKLGFHSHNNMQLAFSNSQLFLEQQTNRDLIIDSTLMGIGRGAGNLSTEMIARYLNFKNGKDYDIDLILKTIEDKIQPIYNDNPWGYSIPYYISALNCCHPNYAKYLTENTNISYEDMNKILKLIPIEKKIVFDIETIEQLFLDFKNNL